MVLRLSALSRFGGVFTAFAFGFFATTALPVTAFAQQQQQQQKPAAGQKAQPQKPQPQQPVQISGKPSLGDQEPWVKLCGPDPVLKKEVCQIEQETRADTGVFLAAVALVELKEQGKRRVLIKVPQYEGVTVSAGFRAQIDQNKPVIGQYSVCLAGLCFGTAEVGADFVNQMKKGTNITITMLNAQGKAISFNLTLGGFGKSYDGAAKDPKVFDEQRKKLDEELTKKADEARKKYEEEQKKSGAGSAPAAGGAAPAVSTPAAPKQ